MKRTVALSTLARGRTFTFSGRRYKVARNLGESGVSVRSAVEREVTIGERRFKTTESRTEVWSAGSPVEIETRE